MNAATPTNGTLPLEERVHAIEDNVASLAEASKQHDYAMGKVAAFEAHLTRFESKLDDQGDDLRRLTKAVERLAGRASTNDDVVTDAARVALGLAKEKPAESRVRWALVVKVVLAVLALATTALAGHFAR